MKHTLLLPVFFLLALTGFAQEKSSPKNKKAPKIPTGVRVIRDLEFAEHDGVSLKLDLYLPEKVDAKTALPVVIWIHGGGWKNGNKNNCKAAFLAAHDFAVASISYRLTDVAQWPAQINDCYAAVRWLRQNAAKHGLDGEKIGVWGGSAGAHLAALVGTRKFDGEEKVSSRVRAVCNWYGPSELLTMPPNTIGNGRTREQVEQSNGAKLLGATVMDVPELAKDASALDQVSADDPPFLIMHGSKDPGVPLEQSQKLHDKLKAAGVESELVVIEGAGHGGKEFQTDEVRNRIRDFFAKHLKNG
ncbi:MAG: alpha/beta hydrolase [Verrucomicrobiales bacterium]|nr:alpha/beta hydrolase [Verrucomicrobiales bacterium]